MGMLVKITKVEDSQVEIEIRVLDNGKVKVRKEQIHQDKKMALLETMIREEWV